MCVYYVRFPDSVYSSTSIMTQKEASAMSQCEGFSVSV